MADEDDKAGVSSHRYTVDAVTKTGASERTVRREVARGRAIPSGLSDAAAR
jgi:hypothetical protein